VLVKVYTAPDKWHFVQTEEPENSLPVKVKNIQSAGKSELSKKRFDICKTCDNASETGFKCSLYKGCCFGKWRTIATNQCPLGKWPAIEKPAKDKE